MAGSLKDDATAMVGIFWWVEDRLVAAGCPLGDAEAGGEWLDYTGGHAEHWERWREAGRGWLLANELPLLILSSEYDDHPRGRIVFDRSTGRFLLYADLRLQDPDRIAAIKRTFGLDRSTVIVESDPHYR